MRQIGDNEEQWCAAANNLACSLIHNGELREAEALLRCTANSESASPSAKATSLLNLGILMESQKRHVEAEKCYLEALKEPQSEEGKRLNDKCIVADICGALAVHYEAIRRNSDAERYYRKALDAQLHGQSQQDPRTLNTLSHLTGLYQDMLGVDIQSANTLLNLGQLYKAQGKPHDAERFFVHALEIQEAHLKPTDGKIVSTLDSLLVLYEQMGCEEELVKVQQRLKVIERYLQKDIGGIWNANLASKSRNTDSSN